MAELYAGDALLLPPGSPGVKGWPANRAAPALTSEERLRGQSSEARPPPEGEQEEALTTPYGVRLRNTFTSPAMALTVTTSTLPSPFRSAAASADAPSALHDVAAPNVPSPAPRSR